MGKSNKVSARSRAITTVEDRPVVISKKKKNQRCENQIGWVQDLGQLPLQRTCPWYTGKKRENQDMVWLRLVGSFKLYVSFAKYRLFYRAILQKRPVI